MKREIATEHLIRIIQVIESGLLPVRASGLYVFGSYARGALNPKDLDLVLVYDHDQEEWEALLKRAYELYPGENFAGYKMREGAIRKAFLKPGLSLDLDVTPKFPPDIAGPGGTVTPEELILIWSRDDNKWRERLKAIKPDETAGRAKRNHLVDLKRTRSQLTDMNAIGKLVDAAAIICKRTEVNSLKFPRLTQFHQAKLARYLEEGFFGRDTLNCLPFVLSWFQQYKTTYEYHTRNTFFDQRHRYYFFVGRIPIYAAYGYLTDDRVRNVGMLPFLKKVDRNEILDFSRGPNWNKCDEIDAWGKY